MSVFKILILVCSMATSHADCQPGTAINSALGPVVKSEVQCGLIGQATLAQTSLRPRPGEEYLKIVCRRDSGAEKDATP
jgi:hypothetical protein